MSFFYDLWVLDSISSYQNNTITFWYHQSDYENSSEHHLSLNKGNSILNYLELRTKFMTLLTNLVP
jgi:hypothetical protein